MRIRHLIVVILLLASTLAALALPLVTTPVIDAVVPDSTLLPSGATTLALSVTTRMPAHCRYALGAPLPYAQMTPFTSSGDLQHCTVVRGLNPDPSVLNHLYLRTERNPDEVVHVQYRCLPAPATHYPRMANLWGSSGYVKERGLAACARVDLWLGAGFSPEQIATLRRLNPHIIILDSINAVENNDVPDSYFLRDIHGKKIEVWPGAYRLNLTNPRVAIYQAHYAYDKMVASGLSFDGCFFDNVMMSQSWQREDIYGNPVQIDTNGNGKAVDPATFDAAWRAGVLLEMKTWRQLMPYAYTSGHIGAMSGDTEVAMLFNGQSIGFASVDALEGRIPVEDFLRTYAAWCANTCRPSLTSMESAIPSELAYGYDYTPWEKMPPTTQEFARTYYPYMRFGLAATLLDDGYFMQEVGDTWHGNAWWYDELNVDLGTPLGPAVPVVTAKRAGGNLLPAGGFAQPPQGTWAFWSNAAAGCAASVVSDRQDCHSGNAAAHVIIMNAGQHVDWHITLLTPPLSMTAGARYTLTFWAKSNAAHRVAVLLQKNAPDWHDYGLAGTMTTSTQWRSYQITFTATASGGDAVLHFNLGDATGEIWIDDVNLALSDDALYQRTFTRGMVLLNPLPTAQTLRLAPGYQRLSGEQAPRYQYIVDNSDVAFRAPSSATIVILDSGRLTAVGPFYHNWGKDCCRLEANTSAQWDLHLPADDQYTLQAWWPAAPQSGQWSKQAVYEVVAHGVVLASATLDQTQSGDQWHTIADKLPLRAGDHPVVRLHDSDGRPCIADAIYLASASRYNDGSPVEQVTLAPLDGVVLVRTSSVTRGE